MRFKKDILKVKRNAVEIKHKVHFYNLHGLSNGGLLFGYDWVVIGGAKPFYEQFFNISQSPTLQGWAMSFALIGCLLSALLSGVFSDLYGRKKLLIFSTFLFTISAVGTGASNTFTPFVFYRILGGIGISLASNLSPMNIAEM